MNGILLVDKPSGWTSNDVVAKLKGVLHERRIGHSGTLDPMATGLLVVFVGRATRAVEFAEADNKQYIAGLRPGITTDTQDITGTVLSSRAPALRPGELEAVLRQYEGQLEQIPPMYSAIKVKGQRLYEIARKGGEVERKPRKITIHGICLLGNDGQDYHLRVDCSKGTYIRTLCNDIGNTLGCGGCMSALRRTKAGVFSVEEAHTLEEIIAAAAQGNAESLLLPVDCLFSGYPECSLNEFEETKLRNGNSCMTRIPDGCYRAYSGQHSFFALVQVKESRLSLIKSFYEV